MAAKENFKYDAFISYRHSELDSFVAENVHHELEKFKLPKNLVKTRGEGEKTKIERVFRDRDELPISSDLSDNITKALESTDYLIVICTPRLKESIWCKSEIETFISLRGRERVLAVLAEGEPADSFPESITKDKKVTIGSNGEEVVTWVDVEPLAADVRGASKSEIKKKIKEEVIRLAAAIFECNYDEIKQRHREQVLRNRVRIATGVAAACLVFGGMVSAQALRINKQNKKIDEQYKEINAQYEQIDAQYNQIQEQYSEIEAQYSENLIKQSQVVMTQVDTYLRAGRVDDSKTLILDSINAAGDKLPNEAAINYRNKLAQVLGCYDNGRIMQPKGNLMMDASVAIMLASPDYKYLAASDVNGVVAVWEVETLKKVAEVKTDFINATEANSRYGFDVKSNFVFVGDNSMNAISCNGEGKNWTTEIKYCQDFAGIDANTILAASTDAFYVIDRASGDIKNTFEYDSDVKNHLKFIDSMHRTNDNKYMLVAGSGDDKVCILKVDLSNYSVVSKTLLDAKSVISSIVTSDGRYVVETMSYTSSLSDSSYQFVCFDSESMNQLWTKETDNYISSIFEYGGNIIAFYSGGVYKFDLNTFDVIDQCQLDRVVSDPLGMSDGRLKLLLTDGSIKIQNLDSFTFFENGDNDIENTNIKMFKSLGTQYAVAGHRSNSICIYGLYATKDATPADGSAATSEINRFEKECQHGNTTATLEGDKIIDGSVTVDLGTSFVDGFYIDEKSNSYIVMYGDKKIESIKLDENNNKVVLNTVNAQFSASVIDMSDDYYVIVCDSDEGYVVNRSNGMIEACVYGYAGYDKDSNTFLAKAGSEKYYTVPFFTLDELVKKAQ